MTETTPNLYDFYINISDNKKFYNFVQVYQYFDILENKVKELKLEYSLDQKINDFPTFTLTKIIKDGSEIYERILEKIISKDINNVLLRSLFFVLTSYFGNFSTTTDLPKLLGEFNNIIFPSNDYNSEESFELYKSEVLNFLKDKFNYSSQSGRHTYLPIDTKSIESINYSRSTSGNSDSVTKIKDELNNIFGQNGINYISSKEILAERTTPEEYVKELVKEWSDSNKNSFDSIPQSEVDIFLESIRNIDLNSFQNLKFYSANIYNSSDFPLDNSVLTKKDIIDMNQNYSSPQDHLSLKDAITIYKNIIDKNGDFKTKYSRYYKYYLDMPDEKVTFIKDANNYIHNNNSQDQIQDYRDELITTFNDPSNSPQLTLTQIENDRLDGSSSISGLASTMTDIIDKRENPSGGSTQTVSVDAKVKTLLSSNYTSQNYPNVEGWQNKNNSSDTTSVAEILNFKTNVLEILNFFVEDQEMNKNFIEKAIKNLPSIEVPFVKLEENIDLSHISNPSTSTRDFNLFAFYNFDSGFNNLGLADLSDLNKSIIIPEKSELSPVLKSERKDLNLFVSNGLMKTFTTKDPQTARFSIGQITNTSELSVKEIIDQASLETINTSIIYLPQKPKRFFISDLPQAPIFDEISISSTTIYYNNKSSYFNLNHTLDYYKNNSINIFSSYILRKIKEYLSSL